MLMETCSWRRSERNGIENMGNERLVVKQRMFEGGDRFDYFSQTNRLDKVTSHEGAKPPNKNYSINILKVS